MSDHLTHDRTGEDIIDVILEQHDAIRDLFTEMEQCNPEDRQDTFQALVRLLAVHETAEEEIVYPALRRHGGENVVETRTAEEDTAKRALADLEGMDPMSPLFMNQFAAFEHDVQAHAGKEEAEVLPLLREFDQDQRRRMATAFTLAEGLAPTRAHTWSPESATGNMLAGPFVAMVDRVRDALRDRRSDR